MIKNQTVYREGDPADCVYIIKSGQFEVTKMLVSKNTGLAAISHTSEKESTKQIFKNPLKAQKMVNTQKLNLSLKATKTQLYLFRLEKGNIIGDEDLISKQKVYRTTVKCTSIDGLIGCMKKDDFYRLENQP